MLPDQKKKANIGVGVGILLVIVGLFLMVPSPPLGLLTRLAGGCFYVWGCWNYAEGKGYSGWSGLWGLTCIGLVVLIFITDHNKESKQRSRQRMARSERIHKIKQIAVALHHYGEENAGLFPKNLADLRSHLPTGFCLEEYESLPCNTNSPDALIAREVRPDEEGFRAVAFKDGNATFLRQ